MFCALDIWPLGAESGAPSLFQTLQAYHDAGHTVHLVSPTLGANAAFVSARNRMPIGCRQGVSLPGLSRVKVYRVHVPSLRALAWPWPARLLWIDQKLRYAMVFPVLAAQQGLKLIAQEPVDLLYGYEVHGVLAARLVRLWQPLPLVTRFQGTVVTPILADPLQFIRKIDEIAALKTPADLTIMTDDGTEGNRAVRRLLGRLPHGFRFWRNGIDKERLRPATNDESQAARAALQIEKNRFVVVVVSRLVLWKRVDRAVLAAARLRERLPALQLLIVGDGEERPRLERLVADLGLGALVRFEGAVPQREVVRYYQAADVFLSTNDLSNAGNPLLEAMACGKAIVTLNNGSTGRLIQHGTTGLLLATTSGPEAIADAIEHLAHNAALRRRLATAARTYVEQRLWTWEERMAAELRDVEALWERRS